MTREPDKDERRRRAVRMMRALRRYRLEVQQTRTWVASAEERLYALSSRYLGGKTFWQRGLGSRADIHSAIVSGVGYGSVIFLVSHMQGLAKGDVAKALGISVRTLRRRSDSPEAQMPANLASKAWLLAETLARSTEIFGGKEEAERWMSKPAVGLDGQRPIALLRTLQGAELVNDFLTRLEYGVYS
jgi:putative toxin-antitoxin system antitoxin component (TIGR02293 family)